MSKSEQLTDKRADGVRISAETNNGRQGTGDPGRRLRCDGDRERHRLDDPAGVAEHLDSLLERRSDTRHRPLERIANPAVGKSLRHRFDGQDPCELEANSDRDRQCAGAGLLGVVSDSRDIADGASSLSVAGINDERHWQNPHRCAVALRPLAAGPDQRPVSAHVEPLQGPERRGSETGQAPGTKIDQHLGGDGLRVGAGPGNGSQRRECQLRVVRHGSRHQLDIRWNTTRVLHAGTKRVADGPAEQRAEDTVVEVRPGVTRRVVRVGRIVHDFRLSENT